MGRSDSLGLSRILLCWLVSTTPRGGGPEGLPGSRLHSSCVPRPKTPAESPGPCLPRSLLVGFRLHVTVALRFLTTLEAIDQASEWCGHSCGPQDSLCTLHMSRSVGSRPPGYRPDRSALTSSTCATLGTGGWLSLASMGLRSHTVPAGTSTPQVKPGFGPAHRELCRKLGRVQRVVPQSLFDWIPAASPVTIMGGRLWSP